MLQSKAYTHSRRTLIFGSDGLRPDLVNAELMPTYFRLMKEGAFFRRFYSVYPSETRVAMTSFTTGVYPGRHGVVANRPYLPGFGANGYLQTGDHRDLLAYQKQFARSLVLRPTLGDRLFACGKHLSVAGNGSPGCNLLWNLQRPEKILNASTDYGVPELRALHSHLGSPPQGNSFAPLEWITKAFIQHQLPDESNAVMVLWLAQPDHSAHATGLGSESFRKALQCVDECLAIVLRALEQRGEEINLLLLSDHGHSTIDAQGSLETHVATACEELKVNARALTVSGQGIYQIGRITDHELQALAHWIRDQPWCGSLYLNHPNAEEWKALPVESLLGPVEEGRAPLVIVNPTWSPRLNKHGVMGVTQLTVNDGWSTHGNAVPTDMQAFCVGWGPGFKKSYLSDIPAGIVDIAPTICHLHGLGRQGGFDGRALHEALADGDHVPHWTSSVEGRPHQRQPLQTAQVRTTRYILGCEVHRV